MPARLPRSTTALVAVTGLVVTGLAVLVLAPAAQADEPTPDCSAATTCTVTYGATGGPQTFTVPSTVTSVTASLRGARGGPSAPGGSTSATVAVVPGSTMTLVVGQSGGPDNAGAPYGGGGQTSQTGPYEGGGGTFLFDSTDHLLLAAGGGGGGTRNGNAGTRGIGGGGGGVAGGAGTGAKLTGYSYTGSTGGTASAGGSGGVTVDNGTTKAAGGNGTGPTTSPDNLGTGGTGVLDTSIIGGGGGGGGGGYYGGGGGSKVQAGGGGSGFVLDSPKVTNASTTTGAGSLSGGDITLSWAKTTATTTTLAASPTLGAYEGDSVTLTATVSADSGTPDGTVAFKDGSTTITGCDATTLVNGSADCTTKVAAGSRSLTASYSGSANYATSDSTTLSYIVATPPSITTTTLPDGTYTTDYSNKISVTGGYGPYTFTSTGNLPDGLVLAGSGSFGKLSGKPSKAGVYKFTVTATDQNNKTDDQDFTLTVAKASQTVSFSLPQTAQTVGDTYTIADATKGDGTKALAFTGNDKCSVAGSEITFTHSGTCTVTANQDGDDNYTAADPVSHDAAVGQGTQAINFTSTAPTAAQVFGDTYTVSAKGGASDKPVTFTGNDSCTISAASGNEATVTFVKPGTCKITADQEGDDDYTAATSEVQSFTVDKATQVVAAVSEPKDAVVGKTFDLVVTGGKSSALVSLDLNDLRNYSDSACSLSAVTMSAPDGVQQAAATIYFTRVGTCVIGLEQGGDDNYSAATRSVLEIGVAGIPTSTSVTLSAGAGGTVVHGQPVTATATVEVSRPGDVAATGDVVFSVDGKFYDSQPFDGTGPVISRNLAEAPKTPNGVHPNGVKRTGLAVGGHTVTAKFIPTPDAGNNTAPQAGDFYASSETAIGSSLTVNPASTTTTLKVNAHSLVATVSVKKPSTDVATGSVTFLVGGKEVGTVEVVDDVATLDYSTPAGKAVSAIYSGHDDSSNNTELSSSSASTARTKPTITARVTSSKTRSKAGWYSRPVTIRFSCSDTVTSCPNTVTVRRNGMTTIKRTVTDSDGGVATINVTVKVDRTRPTVTITGVKAGRTYAGPLPKTRCTASDKTSGIVSCRLVRKTNSTKVKYTAIATDRAGNTTTKTVRIKRTPVFITGANYSGKYPVVTLGKSYTLVYTGKGKPRYVDAAPSPVKPRGDDGPFTKIGKNRWAYSVVFTRNLRSHSIWSFGVKIGSKTLVVKVKVVE